MRRPTETGGVIVRIEPGSLADELDLRPGDILLQVNDRPVRDVLDVQFYAAEDTATLLVRRDDEDTYYEVDKEPDEPLGLEFTEPVFDGVRRCANACSFCFVDQMPPGLRPSLYVKDDDLRYSFLYGNFLTLTNFTPGDWDRLAEQRLSPLYVSVHTTDPEQRAGLFRNPRAAAIMDDLRRLGNLGIQVHAQIVISPGVNDGPYLDRTLDDLAALYPTVQSVAVVPVGLTRYHQGDARPVTPAEARSLVRTIERWHRRCRAEWGVGWAYASDELYLLAGRRIPARRRYDGFPQLENGVGLTRLLLDDAKQILNPQSKISNLQLVCGTLVAPTLQRLVDKLGAPWTVVPVVNRFFGSTVTVSGLLTAADVLDALADVPPGAVVVLPRAMFAVRNGGRNGGGERTLDDVTLADLEVRLGRPIVVAETLSQVVRSLSAEPHPGC
ncbi:MAG: DUF512 domain-containing protein [Chloroflexi bacterium]|nr:DUF512 domain-containing protein [Chloroflexota bacterium]MBU1746308.1 DUF512 domain-containing protein [Chloroflexota bacterium]